MRFHLLPLMIGGAMAPVLLGGEASDSSSDAATSWFNTSNSKPYEHLHFSSQGTPIVHSFNIEPAFTGRDLFTTYSYRDGNEADEQELGLELEWAFTRQIGMIVELPGIQENAKPGPSREGWGDMAVVPRMLLHEGDRFMLTGQVEVVLPTGSHGFGGDTAVAPGINTWLDLGNWWTLNSQLAVEHVFDANSTEAIFGLGLVKTIGAAKEHQHCTEHHHQTHDGLMHLHAEITGSMGLNGEEDGDVNLQGLLGISYGLSDTLDIRCGYEMPLSSPRDFDHGVVFGLIWHL